MSDRLNSKIQKIKSMACGFLHQFPTDPYRPQVGQRYSPEQVCPVLLEFIRRRTSTELGGEALAIENVIYAFSTYFKPETEQEFERLKRYVETNTNWSKDDRQRVILAISSVEKSKQ